MSTFVTRHALGAMLVAFWSGCGGSAPAPSDVPGADTARDLGAAQDVVDAAADREAPDASVDVMAPDVAPDAGPITDPCSPGAIVDLTATEADEEGVVRLVGDTSMAMPMGGLVAPGSCIQNSRVRSGYQLIVRYRMRSARGLVVSTANPETQANFDTVLMLATMCTRGGAPIACADDISTRDVRSTVVSSGALAMGAEVFISIGGYTPPTSAAFVARGEFELSIREVAPLAEGASCTIEDVCPTGATCVVDVASPTTRRCRARGAEFGACRDTEPRCDRMAFRCSNVSPGGPGLCVTPVATGSPCSTTVSCMEGASCMLVPGSTTMRVCTVIPVDGGVSDVPSDVRADAAAD